MRARSEADRVRRILARNEELLARQKIRAQKTTNPLKGAVLLEEVRKTRRFVQELKLRMQDLNAWQQD